MRIGIAGLSHESNQFSGHPTELEDFDVFGGEDILRRYVGRTYVGGVVDAAGSEHELVPLVHAIAQPQGPITRRAFETLLGMLRDAVADAGPLDALILEIHGAGLAAGESDVEGRVLREVRGIVGDAVPIVTTQDLHGNLSYASVALADAVLVVKHNPHDDMFETGQAAVRLLERMRGEGVRPAAHLEKLPLLFPPLATTSGAGERILAVCDAAERSDPRIIRCSFVHGFPYADHADVGAGVLVLTDGDPELAARVARDCASFAWAQRDDLAVAHATPAEAIGIAQRTPGLVVINETSDNTGAGAPGDGTHLLRVLLDADLERSVFVGLVDPEAVDDAHRAGVGSTIRVRLGGRAGGIGGEPVDVEAYVKCLTDGDIALTTPILRGSSWPLGRTARLQVGRVDVIVTTNRVQTFDRTPLLLHGIDVADCRIVALKSSQHFRAEYETLADLIVTVDAPGISTTRLDVFDYQRLREPMHPLHPGADWNGTQEVSR